MPLLKSINQNQNPESSFQLIPKTNHTTPENGPLMITINGEIYEVIFDVGCFSSTSHLTPALIQVLFDNEKLYRIRCREQWRFNIKSSQLKQLLSFICFDNIPQQLGSIEGHISPIGPIQFSILHFPPDFFCIRLGIPYDSKTPHFGIGFLKVEAVIDIFKKRIQSKFQKMNIYQLRFEFVHFLNRIRYFNIFDYNDFRSFSFFFFLKMFPLGNHVRKEISLNMFYSFVEYLMMGNRCFMIHGQKIHQVKGRLSSGFTKITKLFSERVDPVINFYDDKTGCVGISVLKSPEHTSTCHLISLDTMEVLDVGLLLNLNIHFRVEDDIIKVITENHPDIDDDEPSLLKRTPTRGNDVSSIKNGIIKIAGYKFFIFKTYICIRPVISYFIQKRDGTFEAFPSFFLTLLHIFCPDNRYLQVGNYLDGSIDWIVNEIVLSGFEPIFHRTATPDELHYFLMKSQFGVLIQILRHEYETHKNALCAGSRDSIRETTHFKNFKRVLEMILGLFRERKISELTPEIHELLEFIEVMIQL